MAGLDRRGPDGEGPRTGRHLGKCRPLDTDVEVNEVDCVNDRYFQQEDDDAIRGAGRGGLSRGCGCGFGFGGGMRPGTRAARAGRAGRSGRGRGGFGRRRG